MKYLFILSAVLLDLTAYSQSDYYIQTNSTLNANINSNIKANINHNISGTVFEHKTIRTIDYGALQLANAQNERLRFEQERFEDDRQKRVALEIAADPQKAYDYGYPYTFCTNDRNLVSKADAERYSNNTGFKNFCMSYVVPNVSLFNGLGQGKFQNVTKDGLKSEIILFPPNYNKDNVMVDLESTYNNDRLVVGEYFENTDESGKKTKMYLHQKDFNRADVFGTRGYKSTIIWEDDYEYGINDYYVSFDGSIGNGFMNVVIVKFYGDKDEVTFEQLEGRRYYLRQLIDKTVATGRTFNLKL